MFIKIVIFSLIVFTLTGCYNTRHATIDESITKPVLVEKPFFIYPQSARENRISGKVHLIMSLNTYGNVDSVVIDKSSGYKSLDKSAAEFVKNFKFNPALKNGTPINFYVSYTIDYTLAEKNKTAIEYIKNITELQKRIKNAPPAEQVELQKEMLALHNNFIMTNTDYPSYNQYIREFINKDQYKKWRKLGESWPLHFLVFHDFLQTYPDSKILKAARADMFKYIVKDINYVKELSYDEPAVLTEKEDYLNDIRNFLKQNYSDFLPDTLSF